MKPQDSSENAKSITSGSGYRSEGGGTQGGSGSAYGKAGEHSKSDEIFDAEKKIAGQTGADANSNFGQGLRTDQKRSQFESESKSELETSDMDHSGVSTAPNVP
jgi:hypothetical protein